MQIIADGAGAAIALDGQAERNAAAIEADAANAAPREKTENAAGTAADVQDQRMRIESVNQIHQRGGHDGANVFRVASWNPVERMLVVESLLFSCGHFSIPARASNSLPSAPSGDPNPAARRRRGSLLATSDIANDRIAASELRRRALVVPERSPDRRGRQSRTGCHTRR